MIDNHAVYLSKLFDDRSNRFTNSIFVGNLALICFCFDLVILLQGLGAFNRFLGGIVPLSTIAFDVLTR